MDYEKLTEARLTEMESPEYWDQFERGVLAPEKRPSPKEAAEFVRHLWSCIRIEQGLKRGMKCDMQLTTQSYGQFIDAVESLARKYRPPSPNVRGEPRPSKI